MRVSSSAPAPSRACTDKPCCTAKRKAAIRSASARYIDLIKRDRRTLRASFDYYRAIDDDIPANRERMKTRLSMPVLGFAGALACAGAVEEQLRRVADDARCAVIPDCGHFVPEETPDALLALLTPFLEPYRAAAS